MQPGEKLLTVTHRLSTARNHFHTQGEDTATPRTFHGDWRDCPLCREAMEPTPGPFGEQLLD